MQAKVNQYKTEETTGYLMQTIGMAIQRRNSSCILETVSDSKKLDGVYYL